MGGIVSHEINGSSLQPAILAAIAKKKAEDALLYPPMNFEYLLTKFSIIHIGLTEIKRAFHRYSKNDTLSKQDLAMAVKTLHEEVTEEQIKAVFNLSDVNNSTTIDFREFIVSLVISHILHDHPEPTTITSNYHIIKEMLGLVSSCYILLDKEGKGYITKTDVDQFLKDSDKIKIDELTHDFGKKLLSEHHWNLLDWDKNSKIDFAHFCNMFASFVIDVDENHTAKHTSFAQEQKSKSTLTQFAIDLKLPIPPETNENITNELSSDAKFHNTIMMALKKKKVDDSRVKVTFERILLKFDEMHDVVGFLRETFNKFANKSHLLNRDKLVNAVQTFNKSAQAENINRIFELSDLDTSRMIDFKEFITALTIATVIGELPLVSARSEEGQAIKYADIQEMLGLITSAYLIFDPDCKGFISKDSVNTLIESHAQKNHKNAHVHEAHGDHLLSEERWAEMDWDGNGCIDYAEFTCTFAGWAIDIDGAEHQDSFKAKNRTSVTFESPPAVASPAVLNKKISFNEMKKVAVRAATDPGESDKSVSSEKRSFKSDISRALKKKKNDDGSTFSIDKILLNFKKLNTNFKVTKLAFDKYAKNDGLTRPSLIAAIQSMNADADPERISLIFDLSDVDTSRLIDYKEFLTALTIALVLNELPPAPKAPEESLSKYNSLRECLGLIVSAFLLFDPQCKGQFSKDTDIKSIDGGGGFLTEERWNELDWDKNGCCDFAEFTCAFTGWVMDTDELAA